ncbi:MAG: extensin family protein [Mesorhizobium sp.]|nr:extensin family protein [Mesorhizobium sp.]MBL8576701.1 extensin family protein [Mesorhizobium sp.]
MANHRHPSALDGRARSRAISSVGLVALATFLAACTTGSVLSLQPAVDVGSSTASVPRVAEPLPRGMVLQDVQSPDLQSPTVQQSVVQSPTVEQTDVFSPDMQAEVPAEVQTAAVVRSGQGAGMQALAPKDPYLAGYPRMDPPAAPGNYLSADEVDCRKQLKRLKVEFTDVAPLRDGQCGINNPVKVTAIGGVKMKPAATLTCAMALTFSQWTRNELVPSARKRYFTGVKTINQGSSYSCRKIAGSRTLSEHGKGNALDIMSIELNNGKDIDVKKPGFFSFRQKGLLNTVRADGCQYFSTVLGPGYNYDHRNHFHFDIKERRNTACH